MRSAAIGLAGSVILAGGCATGGPIGSPSATETGVLPSLQAPDPSTVGLTCGDEIVFHPALIAGSGSAERDSDPAAEALRQELRTSPPEAGLPASGWFRVAQLSTRVRFVARGGSETGWVQYGTVFRDGSWQLDLVGQCRLQPFVPADVTVAVWWLDPAAPPPDASTTQFPILLQEVACSSGQSPEGRVLPPAVVATPESVTATFLVRRRPGGNDCQGTRPLAMVFEMPEPLGSRRLLDGGSFPPRDASVPAP